MYIMVSVTLIVCIIFTLVELIGTKMNPFVKLSKLPTDIQDRARSFTRYEEGVGKPLFIKVRTEEKIPVFVVLLTVFTGIVYVSGARNFWQGFGCTFLMWLVVKLYVTGVLCCGWYAHTPAVWIPGTKDMVASYQNYLFYLSSIPRSLGVGTMIGVLIGTIIQLAA